MRRTHIGASLPEAFPTASPVHIGLTNPATRFRKLLPYLGTGLVVITAVAGYATIQRMASSGDWLGHTYEVKSEFADLELNHALLHEAERAGAALSADARTRLASHSQTAACAAAGRGGIRRRGAELK